MYEQPKVKNKRISRRMSMLINQIRKNGFGEAIVEFLEGKNGYSHTVYAYIAGEIYDVSYDAQKGWQFKVDGIGTAKTFYCSFKDSCLLLEGDWIEAVGTLHSATRNHPSHIHIVDMCKGEKNIKFNDAVVPYPIRLGRGLQAKFNPNGCEVLGAWSGIFYKDPKNIFKEDTTYAIGIIETDGQVAFVNLEEIGST